MGENLPAYSPRRAANKLIPLADSRRVLKSWAGYLPILLHHSEYEVTRSLNGLQFALTHRSGA